MAQPPAPEMSEGHGIRIRERDRTSSRQTDDSYDSYGNRTDIGGKHFMPRNCRKFVLQSRKEENGKIIENYFDRQSLQ